MNNLTQLYVRGHVVFEIQPLKFTCPHSYRFLFENKFKTPNMFGCNENEVTRDIRNFYACGTIRKFQGTFERIPQSSDQKLPSVHLFRWRIF
jgi:hypothetical protein